MSSRAPMIFALSGLALLALLLFQFWFSESGWFAVRELQANVDAQVRQAASLAQDNRVLAAEVMTMKEGNEAVEARARADLGMVAEGETFYVVVDGGGPESGGSVGEGAPPPGMPWSASESDAQRP